MKRAFDVWPKPPFTGAEIDQLRRGSNPQAPGDDAAGNCIVAQPLPADPAAYRIERQRHHWLIFIPFRLLGWFLLGIVAWVVFGWPQDQTTGLLVGIGAVVLTLRPKRPVVFRIRKR